LEHEDRGARGPDPEYSIVNLARILKPARLEIHREERL